MPTIQDYPSLIMLGWTEAQVVEYEVLMGMREAILRSLEAELKLTEEFDQWN